MKRLYSLIAFLLLAFAFASCKKEDCGCDAEKLDGAWHLATVTGGLAGVDLTYNRGEVIWDFNENTKKLHVTNNILTQGPKQNMALLPTGVYSAYAIETNGIKTLFVDSMSVGVYTISNKTLTLDEGQPVDGLLRTFNR